MPPRHWLMKTEPSVFSFGDLLARPGRTDCWEGVRNYQARNHMMEMKEGDRVLFYHSNAEPPHVAGLAEVAREAYPDHSAFDPKSKYFDPKSDRAQLNRLLSQTERALILPNGLPNRPWFRHAIYAPGEYTGYAAVVLPGVNEAIDASDRPRAAAELVRVTDALNRATALLESYH